MFAKPKVRLDPETNLEAIKLLTGLRALNEALEYAEHWNLEMPTLENLRYDVPSWARFFGQGDISSAFESMWLKDGQQHLLTVVPPMKLGPEGFSEEDLREFGIGEEEIQTLLRQEGEWLLQWEGVPQGLAPAAPFWNVHLAAGLNRLFKGEWRHWFLLYVDNALPFSLTKAHGEAKPRLFEITMEVLGNELLTKVDNIITAGGHMVGERFTLTEITEVITISTPPHPPPS